MQDVASLNSDRLTRSKIPGVVRIISNALSPKQTYFHQTQPFIIILNTTCFDQKLIILGCFNIKVLKTM